MRNNSLLYTDTEGAARCLASLVPAQGMPMVLGFKEYLVHSLMFLNHSSAPLGRIGISHLKVLALNFSLKST